ncbi:myoneurin-like [Cydia amplana]|uniref:myoneurin-like n=1 Tax=Cydia amplana TaxID=1869771 RepID=UPI002FE6976D
MSILEAKPEPVTVKTELGIEPPTTNLESYSSATVEVKFLDDEVHVKTETDNTDGHNSNFDSTLSCAGDSHMDPDPCLGMKDGSTDPLRGSTSPLQNIIIKISEPAQNVLKKVPVVKQSVPIKVISESASQNPETNTTSKDLIIAKPQPKSVQLAKIPPSAKATIVAPTTKVTTKGMVAENAAKVVPKTYSFEKHHKCATCGKTYAMASGLRRHVASAHEHAPKRRPHVCHLCGKSFTATKSLKEHLLCHQGIRPFQCKLCPATFTYSAALFTHNRLKHLKMKWKKKAGNGTAGVEKGVGEVGKGVGEVGKGVEEVGKGVDEVGKGVDKVGKGVEEVGKGVEEVGKVVTEVGKGAESMDIDQFFNKIV